MGKDPGVRAAVLIGGGRVRAGGAKLCSPARKGWER